MMLVAPHFWRIIRVDCSALIAIVKRLYDRLPTKRGGGNGVKPHAVPLEEVDTVESKSATS